MILSGYRLGRWGATKRWVSFVERFAATNHRPCLPVGRNYNRPVGRYYFFILINSMAGIWERLTGDRPQGRNIKEFVVELDKYREQIERNIFSLPPALLEKKCSALYYDEPMVAHGKGFSGMTPQEAAHDEVALGLRSLVIVVNQYIANSKNQNYTEVKDLYESFKKILPVTPISRLPGLIQRFLNPLQKLIELDSGGQ